MSSVSTSSLKWRPLSNSCQTEMILCPWLERLRGRRGGLMVSALHSGSSSGSGPGRGHCVVFLGKALYSHGASLHPDV